MKYVSIDIETTGLNPDTCQIIEFGAVIDDMTTPLGDLPTFRYRVQADTYRGEPFALNMHADFFEEMANRPFLWVNADNDIVGHEDGLGLSFTRWLRKNEIRPHGFTMAGKNVAEFDAQFIRKLSGFGRPDCFQWHHAVLDPGPLYVQPEDEHVPSTAACVARAGGLKDCYIPGKEHSAIYDALVVCALLRDRLGKFVNPG